MKNIVEINFSIKKKTIPRSSNVAVFTKKLFQYLPDNASAL